jgi:ERCC4-type nuclease
MPYLRNKKKSKHKWPITILVDDREKKGWKLNEDKYKTVRIRLAVGDYTIKGYEDRVCVEKKSGLDEFIQNISGAHRERFKRFLTKMSKFEYKILIIEDDLGRTRAALNSLKRTSLTEDSVYHWVTEIMVKYGITVLFSGRSASASKKVVNAVFDRILDNL